MSTTVINYLTPGTVNTSVPSGCTSLVVECYGSGGAGAGNNGAYGAKAGGSGGCYSKKTVSSVVPGQTINITVPGITYGINGNASDGDDCYVVIHSITVCRAKGGISSIGNSPGIGSTTGCIGDIYYDGGDGAAGLDSNYGGGSGGCATTEAPGGDATTSTGGISTGDANGFAGNGADGLINPVTGHGNSGSNYGGGGSGSYTIDEVALGGNGAQGAVKITYTVTDQNMLLALY